MTATNPNAVLTDEQALNAALDADPSDTTTRLVLADWYEENGRDGDAERERWLARMGKWPTYRYSRGVFAYFPDLPWDWFDDDPKELTPDHAKLPLRTFLDTKGMARYKTRREAEADLFRLRDVYESETDQNTGNPV